MNKYNYNPMFCTVVCCLYFGYEIFHEEFVLFLFLISHEDLYFYNLKFNIKFDYILPK